MALTRSRSVMPGCILPLKRTSTDSGMSSGMTPVAAAKATRPEPAGKEMPIGKRVWLIAAGADGVGQQHAVQPGVDDAVAGTQRDAAALAR